MTSPLTADLSLAFLEVVEQAAIACARTMGQGDRHRSDQVAVEAMRARLDHVPIDGRVVIGEGERDKAPMLFIAHSVVDTTARPEMMQRLQALATRARSTDYVEIEGSGHFYVGYEDTFIGAISGWLDKLPRQGVVPG